MAGVDVVLAQVDAGGPEALVLVMALIDAAPTDLGLGKVAAGPLEDLLHAHGDDLVDEIEVLARQSPVFAQALGGVWLSEGAISASTKDRLARWVGLGATPKIDHLCREYAC
jgi:hypothetical protein